MIRRIIQSKFLVVFISAFLCLNLSGSLCLVYCQVKDVKAEAEHCPLMKLDKENCPSTKSENKNNSTALKNSIGENAVDCCIPAINVFAGTLEKNQTSHHTAAAAKEVSSFAKPAVFEKVRYSSNFTYQKPLFDYQTARLKNCVFRI